jgi:hypothetical protein
MERETTGRSPLVNDGQETYESMDVKEKNHGQNTRYDGKYILTEHMTAATLPAEAAKRKAAPRNRH